MLAKHHGQAQAIAIVAAAYVSGILAYPYLPGRFLADKVSPPMLIAFTLPTAALVIYAVFRSLWAHDRIRAGNGPFEVTYNTIVLLTLLFVLVLQALVMIQLTGLTSGVRLSGRPVVVLFGAALVAIGNLLPRTRPNVAVGIRTKRTLVDAQLWQQVHRASGYATVGLGIAVAIAGLVLKGQAVGAVAGAAALLAVMTVVISYRRYAPRATS